MRLPMEVCAIYSCYNQHVVIAFIACETQDFASLLSMRRNKMVNNVVSSQWREPVETQNLASPNGGLRNLSLL